MGHEGRGLKQAMDNDPVLRRKQEILGAATRLFAKYGYRQTDVQYIADSLGIGKGTVYRYFPSKEKLFLAAVDQGMNDLKIRIESAIENSGDPLVQVRTATRVYLDFFYHNPEIIELFIQERSEFKDRQKPTYFVYREANIQRWRELFAELMDRGVVRRMPVDRIVDVMSFAVYGTIFSAQFAGNAKPGEEQAQEILDVIFHGILMDSSGKAGILD